MAKVHMNFASKSRAMEFDTEDDCRQLYRTFGNPETLKIQFPLFYEALERGRHTPLLMEEATGFVDWVTVYSILYDPTQKELEVNFNITLKQPCASLFAYVYSGDASLYESLFFSETQMANITTVFKNVSLSVGESLELFVECPFVSGDENMLKGIRTAVTATYSEHEVIDSITVDAPKLEFNKEAPIKVSFGRTLGYGEVVDYTYPESRTEDGNQKFFLDVEGKVKLLSNYTVKTIKSVQACAMVGGAHGTIIYKNKGGAKTLVDSDKKGFTWNFDYDWKDEIKNSVQYGAREYIFDLSILFSCNETGSEDFRCHVSSHENNPSRSNVKISKIKLYWGCLGKNSRVTMADRSEKEICYIQHGDMVATPDGYGRVVDIIIGTEQYLYRLVTESGLMLDASIMHPILTDQGFLPIRDLSQDTVLVTSRGNEKIRHCYEVDYQDQVYGLELSEGTQFYANGILVGTNQVQGEMYGIPAYREGEFCQALRAEFVNMIQFAGRKGLSNGESISDRY